MNRITMLPDDEAVRTRAVSTWDRSETGPYTSLWTSLERWAYVLRYHRPTQLLRRTAKLAWSRAGLDRLTAKTNGEVPQRRRDRAPIQSVLRRRLRDTDRDAARRLGNNILAGRFAFLCKTVFLNDPVDWRVADVPYVPHLWRFHLHYHEYLMDLAAVAFEDLDTRYVTRAWDLVDQWIRGNPRTDPLARRDAWHPYCISRRLVAWMLLFEAAPPPAGMAGRIIGSLHEQASALDANLELDLGGNHLLQNLLGLLAAGAFFEGPAASRWQVRANRLLRRELEAQVLASGEHFERSPMYHVQMTQLVLDAAEFSQGCDPDLSDHCRLTAQRMEEFTKAIVHPDGVIPLFGDSTLDPPRSAPCLGTSPAADSDGPTSRQVGDYWVYRDSDSFVVLDAGRVGPDHLPAHAHADLLTFEASLFGQRLFVDSGVFGYEDDAMRRYCRGTGAHNTLQIDDMDQCDLWSRFRMGYRGWPTRLRSGCDQDIHWVDASHNGYRRIGVPVVERWFFCRPGRSWICIDSARGSGRHRVQNRLHVHPDVKVQQVTEGRLSLNVAGRRVSLRLLQPAELRIEKSWYCPGFGERILRDAICWTTTGRLPFLNGWQLSWHPDETHAELKRGGCGDYRLSFGSGGHPWRIPVRAAECSPRI